MTTTEKVRPSGIREPSPASKAGVAQSTVLALLEKMPLGLLTVTLPDGTTRTFGQGADDISASVTVNSDEFFVRCLLYADIGLAESYIDGLVEIHSIENLIQWFLLNQESSPVLNESPVVSRLVNLLGVVNRIGHALRPNSKSVSRKNISEHYDLGNSFFSLFLDPSMTYSSALFVDPSMTLAEAQEAKFERIARQLQISEGDRVLEVGCGWGALSCYLARSFNCSVTGLTISEQQYEFASTKVAKEQLDHRVNLRLEDYRDHIGVYDKIVSIEMIEAVGDKFMDTFIQKLDSLLAKDGLLLMQMITSPDSRYETLKANVDFIQKHIFPGSLLPSLYRVNTAMVNSGDLFMVDLLDMTDSYVKTLKEWQLAFEGNIAALEAQGFDDGFIRKWRYYFEYCRAAFGMRNVSVVQATYTRPNNRRLAGGKRTS